MQNINTELNRYDVSKQNLKRSYQDALTEEQFKKIVSFLDVDEKEIMKYTSKIQESAKELKNCKNCKGLVECKNEVCGYVYYPEVYGKKLSFSFKACKYEKEHLKATEYMSNIYYFDEPKSIKEASMKNIDKTDKNRLPVIKWLDDFITNYKTNINIKGLYLHGNFGSGKTYLVAATLNELAKGKTKIAIIYYPEFLRELKASFATDFDEKFNHIKKAPILLIDDLGAENTTPWGRDEILGPILQYRMEAVLPTFITSNLTKEELETHFSITKDKTDKLKSRRIIERISQLTDELSLVSKNRRQ